MSAIAERLAWCDACQAVTKRYSKAGSCRKCQALKVSTLGNARLKALAASGCHPNLGRYHGAGSGKWQDDDVTYHGAHDRVRALHGRPSEHECLECGSQAMDWHYVGGCPRERTDPERGLVYSPDPTYYEPVCRKCHRSLRRAA